MAPALLDGPEYVNRWINDLLSADPDADDTTEETTGTSGLEVHLGRMKSLIRFLDNYLKKSVSNHRIGYGAFTNKNGRG